MNVKVAIRCRPFNQRERSLGAVLCVNMTKTSTRVFSDDGVDRTFNYDHCFWSHDGYVEEENGYMVANSSNSPYCDQKLVYGVLGKDLLENALKGYNVCIFAYGQTGSGKSYSIFGYNSNKGIVPMLCEELLNGKTLVNDEKKSFEMNMSMLEIYNEKIQDLLSAFDNRKKEGLKIRENPQTGVYVEKLTKAPVQTYEDIEHWIEFGNKHKTIAATLMNATSSRAHTVIGIELVQKEVMKLKTIQKTSLINLVDLAGSEKVMKTGAEGDRLKEACSINTSLTQLGIVINQLCEQSEGKNIVISYRDSILTRLLSNALGGNSKTTMICAVSPDKNNIEETMSTLRYANNAKNIKQKAKINESEIDKKIRELTEENDRLKEMLKKLELSKSDNPNLNEEIRSQINQVEMSISNQQHFMQPMRRLDSLTPSSLKPKEELTIENIKVSHMYNLNEDPYLTGRIIFNFEKTNVILVGRQIGDDEIKEKPDSKERRIVLNSVGILEDHAQLTFNKGSLSIIVNDLQAAEATFVNGETLEGYLDEDSGYIRQLHDWDRIIFGTSSTFLVRLCDSNNKLSSKPTSVASRIDWEFCQKEKYNCQEKYIIQNQKQRELENEKRFKEQEEKLAKEMLSTKEAYEKQLKEQESEYQRLFESMKKTAPKGHEEPQETALEVNNRKVLEEMEEAYKSKELEFQAFMNVLQKEREMFEKNKVLSTKIENHLFSYYSKIREANLIAKELNRNIEFSPFVKSINLLNTVNKKELSIENFVNVKVSNMEDGWVNYWTLEKFDNRLTLIKEAIDYFFSRNQIKYSQEDDPFWDPEEFFLFGQSFSMAKNVLYKFELTHKIGMVGYEGDIGHFNVRLVPIDDDLKPIDEEEAEEEIEDPEDLIKKQMSCHFRIMIDRITFYDIDKLHNKSAYLQFEVLEYPDMKEYKTMEFKILDNQVELNYKQNVKIPKVTRDIIWFYMNENILFRLYVRGIEAVEKKGRKPPPIIPSSRKHSLKSTVQRVQIANTFIERKSKNQVTPKKEGTVRRADAVPRKGCQLF
jgi:kinesin family protein 13